ncbi:hypothetical protein IAU59_002062 [Kwoniella sp. CBS 9459]
MSTDFSLAQPPSTPKSSKARPNVTTPHRRTNSLGHASPIDIKPRSPAARRMSMTSTSQSASLTPQSLVERLLGREQLVLAGIISSLMFMGIMYSLIYGTSLDTSHIHHAHQPNRPAYFARKSNILNVLFVKQAWGWTTLLYLIHLVTSPPSTASIDSGIGSRARRLGVWILATGAWLLFARWAFGAGLGDRIIAATGGNCAVRLPAGVDLTVARETFPTLFTAGSDAPSASISSQSSTIYVPLPAQFCGGVPLNPGSLPELFALLPSSATGKMEATSQHAPLQALPRPRWHRGFDISGHAFLLTLSVMVLARELVETWRRWAASAVKRRKVMRLHRGWLGILHQWSGVAATGLVVVWAWMILMTAVYFHNPPEKLSGLLLGLFTSYLINLVIPPSPLTSTSDAISPTTSSSQTFSRPSAGMQGIKLFDENAARRGGIVDDGVIYEAEESDESGDNENQGNVIRPRRMIAVDVDAKEKEEQGTGKGKGKEREKAE